MHGGVYRAAVWGERERERRERGTGNFLELNVSPREFPGALLIRSELPLSSLSLALRSRAFLLFFFSSGGSGVALHGSRSVSACLMKLCCSGEL